MDRRYRAATCEIADLGAWRVEPIGRAQKTFKEHAEDGYAEAASIYGVPHAFGGMPLCPLRFPESPHSGCTLKSIAASLQ
jgi:hypothetical protein